MWMLPYMTVRPQCDALVCLCTNTVEQCIYYLPGCTRSRGQSDEHATSVVYSYTVLWFNHYDGNNWVLMFTAYRQGLAGVQRYVMCVQCNMTASNMSPRETQPHTDHSPSTSIMHHKCIWSTFRRLLSSGIVWWIPDKWRYKLLKMLSLDAVTYILAAEE